MIAKHPCRACENQCEPDLQAKCKKVNDYVTSLGPAGMPYDGDFEITKKLELFTIKDITVPQQHNNKINLLQHKQCRRCNQSKSLLEFYKHPRTKDGHENTCKVCKSEMDRIRNHEKRSKKSPKKADSLIATDTLETKNAIDSECVVVNFKKHPDLLDALIKIADKEFRTPESQILSMIAKHYEP